MQFLSARNRVRQPRTLVGFAVLAGLALLSGLDFANGQETEGGGAGPTIEVKDATGDEAIRERLEKIFHVVDELDSLQIEVEAGVVTLSGRVADDKVREQALALVKRTEGVVMTIDRFEEKAEVGEQLSPALAKLKEIGHKLLVKSPLILLALIVAGLFWSLGSFLYQRESWFDRLKVSSLAKTLVRRIVKLSVTIIGMVLALEILDATAIVGAVLGAAGLAGLAIGFAFKNIMENYLSGILLSTRNPFEIGDVIEINGKTGKVALLTARDTVLLTADGNHLRIPNSVVINSELLNYSRNPRRRFDFTVGDSVELDLAEARRIGMETLLKNPGVLADPKPMILIDSLGDSAVILKFYAWVDQRQSDFMKSKSEAIRMVKVAYDEAGIEMPEPIYRVLVPNGDLPLAGEKRERGGASHPESKEDSRQKSSPADGDVSAQDVSADHTIDEQIAEEQEKSGDENLLGPKPEEDNSSDTKI
jgi:small-conductance mechanosensitive channel